MGATQSIVKIDAAGNFLVATHGDPEAFAVLLRMIADDIGGSDAELFCSRCFAGVTSAEHHEKCATPGYAVDGESAWSAS